MNKALTKQKALKDEFAKELHRAVNDFVAKATDEDVKALLKRAKSETFNKVATPRILTRELGRNRAATVKFVHLSVQTSVAQELANKGSYAAAFSSVAFTKAMLSAAATNRHDLALAA